MELSEKAVKFFDDPKIMKKFGPYAKYVPSLYARVILAAPEMADEVLDRLGRIKVRTKPKLSVGRDGGETYGETARVYYNDRRQTGIKMLVKRPQEIQGAAIPVILKSWGTGKISIETLLQVDAEEYFRRDAFYHEMIHAIAGERPRDGEPSGPGYYDVVTGNATFSRYDLSKTGNNRQNDIRSVMIEEGIVEDWANDLTLEDINNRFTRITERLAIVAYKLSVSLVTCWNLCSNFQLRREFLTGVEDDTEISEKTFVFKQKMMNLYADIMPTNINSKFEYDVDAIAEDYVDLIRYCDENFDRKAHSKAECQKYDMSMAYIKSIWPLCRNIEFYANEVDRPHIKEVQREVEAKLKRMLSYRERHEFDTIWYLNQMAREGRGVIKGDIKISQFVRWYTDDLKYYLTKLPRRVKQATLESLNK